jgi:site-specific DNA-methyltransferase (adenine-specific)
MFPTTNGNNVYQANNLSVLLDLPKESVRLVYMDPPFNTGKVQSDWNGRYDDWYGSRDDYLDFLRARLVAVRQLLTRDGTLYLHMDQREVHYVKVLCDTVFGEANFLNEVIWAYDYGGRSKTRWPKKHDTILVYAKVAGAHVFNFDDIDRIPYMSPGLVGPDKAERGKTPTDVWWHTIVHTTGAERVGYPNQKPLGILRRIILASSHKGDVVLDPFAGSGSFGVAAAELDRRFIMIDDNVDALNVMERRFHAQGIVYERMT